MPEVWSPTGIFAYDHQKNLIISSTIAGAANVLFDILLHPALGNDRIGMSPRSSRKYWVTPISGMP